MDKKLLSKQNLSKILNVLKARKLLLLNISAFIFYFIVVVVAYFRYGAILNFALGIASLIAIPLMAHFGRSHKFIGNFVLCITLLLTYEALRGMTGILVNVDGMFPLASIDRAMFGFNLVGTVQKIFTSSAVTLVSMFFYGLHLPLVIISMALFWFVSKRAYKGYTYSLILTSFLALITFASFPTAPPWFVGSANNLLADGLKMLAWPFSILQKTFAFVEYDKFAAFPSLHMAYAMIFFVYTTKMDKKLSLMSVPILAGVFFSTIYLGQHYVIDLIAGIAYSVIGILIVEGMISRSGPFSSTAIKQSKSSKVGKDAGNPLA